MTIHDPNRAKAVSKERPSKIVFVGNELGSFRHHREHLAHAAMAAGLEPILLASPVGDTSKMNYEYRPIEIERFRLDPLKDLYLFTTLLRLLLRERPQVAHFINLKPYLFGGLAASLSRVTGWKGEVVVTVPGLGRLYDSDGTVPKRVRRAVVEFFLRIAVRRAHVTFETESDRDVWVSRRLVKRAQTTVMRGAGIDLDAFQVTERQKTKSLRVLFASRLLRSKGLDVFLEAAAQINTPGIELIVAGFIEDDPDAVALSEFETAPGIRFLGPVSDMPRLLAQTDIVVLPSRYNEGIPRILIEAAACGCVPIATSFPGSRMIITNGETGFLLDNGSVTEQAQQLTGLIWELKENRERLQSIGERSAAHVSSRGFAADDVARAFLQMYLRSEMIGPSNSGTASR